LFLCRVVVHYAYEQKLFPRLDTETNPSVPAAATQVDCNWHYYWCCRVFRVETVGGVVTVLKRANWYILFGVFFVVLGICYFAINKPVDAAWSVVIGGGNLYFGYAQTHPALGKGRLAWVLVILWLIVLGVLTIMRLTNS
jgi:hypothetical protein